jgi:hypothetical protein
MAINRARFAAPAGVEAAFADNFRQNGKNSEGRFEKTG